MTLHFVALQIDNENVQSNNSTSEEKIQEKTKWLQIMYYSYLRISLPGNRSSKSRMCIMTHGLYLSFTVNLTDLFDTQKESMNFLINSFLHFCQGIL